MCEETTLVHRYALSATEWDIVSTLIEWLDVCLL